MEYSANDILKVFDQCSDSFSFPMLDNGYVYLAATRLSLFRSAFDWALVIEIFGFSPRAGYPDLNVSTFASQLQNRDRPENYVTEGAYLDYLTTNPHNDCRFFAPLGGDRWIDEEEIDFVASKPEGLTLRGEVFDIPRTEDYARHGVVLSEPPRVQVFELCRLLAARERNGVMATPDELRVSIPAELELILQLDQWNHPDLAADERPSQSETFQQLAEVLVSGDIAVYVPSVGPNTHWTFWPEGGTL